MTDQALAIPWAARALGEPRHRLPSIALAASIGAFFVVGTAEAKQQCSTSALSHGYWSWRMIDGRKCWYEGKPMLSKAVLEWRVAAASQQPDTRKDTANAVPENHGDPMDAQAYAPTDPSTFDALWRSRIEGTKP
jgi:hypothetical protein